MVNQHSWHFAQDFDKVKFRNEFKMRLLNLGTQEVLEERQTKDPLRGMAASLNCMHGTFAHQEMPGSTLNRWASVVSSSGLANEQWLCPHGLRL